jgi:DNA invertase Pin-like site-specific DNA recombinase
MAPMRRVMAASLDLGKMPTTSVRRLISPLSRSKGLVEWILRRFGSRRPTRCRAGLCARSAESTIRLSDSADRGVRASGCRNPVYRSPRTATAGDQLLLQFQGMIAEYERAQILERSRRGKRHRARQGQVSVLSRAPLSLCSQERAVGGVLRDRRGGGAGRSIGLRALYR